MTPTKRCLDPGPMTATADLYVFLKTSEPISNILVPFPNVDFDLPVAFVSGVLNLKKSLRHNGMPVVLEEVLEVLEAKQSTLGEVIDLTKATSEMKIDTDGMEEKEIKEKWSEVDVELFNNRGLRVAKAASSRSIISSSPSRKSLPKDIESLLNAAAAEEEESITSPTSVSKVSQLRNECLPEKKSSFHKLPKISVSSSPVLGDIVERKNEASPPATKSVLAEDEVSMRVRLNEVKAVAEKVSKFKQSSRQ